MKENKTAYYVAEELQGKVNLFLKIIENMKDLIETYNKAEFIDKEEVQKKIYEYKCKIEAYQEVVEILENSVDIWEGIINV